MRIRHGTDIQEFVLEHYREHSIRSMSDILGIHPSTISYWVHKMGLFEAIKRDNTRKPRPVSRKGVKPGCFDVNSRENWLV